MPKSKLVVQYNIHMVNEIPPVPHFPNKVENNPISSNFCLYIAGVSGTKRVGLPIQKALEGVYGPGNVEAIASLVSIDRQDRAIKYKDLSKKLFEQMDAGKKLTIVAFSGGPIELVDIIKEMKRNRPDMKQWAKNLEVVLMCPAGIMKGPRETVRFLGHLKDYAKEHLADFPEQGIQSLFMDPPDLSILNAEDLDSVLTIAMANRPQKDLNARSISFATTQFLPDKNIIHFIDEERERLKRNGGDFNKIKQQIDGDLKKAIERRNPKVIRALLLKRYRLYSKPLQKAFDTFVPETKNVFEAAKIYAQMLLGIAHFSHLGITGQVVNTVDELRKEGANINFIAPEFDPVFPLSDGMNKKYAQRLVGKDDLNTAVVGINLSAHADWVMNPIVLAEALRILEQENQNTSK